ncbi:MAG: biopolymer transporter ExbD [Planctomycetia bacterium]|nr:biopolymer transporter ExbD [Planctomycetia bacterium]
MAVHIKKETTLGGMTIMPLVDIVFLLLIFFLVASRFDEDERVMDIRLPEATEAVAMFTEPQELVINITPEGEYVAAGQTFTFDSLAHNFEGPWKERAAVSTVLIRADENAPFRAIVSIANLCRRLEIPYTTIVKEVFQEET